MSIEPKTSCKEKNDEEKNSSKDQRLNFKWFIINIIVRMNTIKSPKSCAYARLTKSKQNSLNDKVQRRSAGNLYEQVLAQFADDHQSYIRQIVGKAPSGSVEPQLQATALERQIEIVHPKIETKKIRQFDSSSPKITAPISSIPQSHKSILKQPSPVKKIKQRSKPKESHFMSGLDTYIQELTQNQPLQDFQPQYVERSLHHTVKIAQKQSNNSSQKLAAELQKSQMKQKQLQLANYYKEKQIQKRKRKQTKMMRVMRDLLEQIQHLNQELTHHQKEKQKMTRLIESIEPHVREDRKTIGRSYLKESRPQWEETKHWKTKTGKVATGHREWGELNPDRIEQMFKSGYGSQVSEPEELSDSDY